ncbi:PREDICTED: major pollen allergen Ole e 10-like [Camelina sativa]|uniref:Major pollen allergen Ole e 10-like n=1 Tax=Camelina sativa TaxID=90675 RepID=A0ABM0VYZ0_CAMSA|nr:PREDICTED: major pollen allergen Ole e 10-like [Camelina sativa]
MKMSSPLTILFIFLSLIMINHLYVVSSTQWCIATLTATNEQLQDNIDCGPIQPGGSCFIPDTLVNHASFVMNAYYQSHGQIMKACSFKNTGTLAATDPSYGSCVYGS